MQSNPWLTNQKFEKMLLIHHHYCNPVGFNAECVHFNHNFCSESWVITENGENVSKLS